MALTARAPMKGGTARTVSTHDTIWRLQVAYAKKVVDTIHSAAAGEGDNVLYEILNEGGGFSDGWQRDLIAEIQTYEAQTTTGACGGATCKTHPVGYTWTNCVEGGSFPTEAGCDAEEDLLGSTADWISLFQFAYTPDEDGDPRVAPSTKVNLSDSDHGYIANGHGGFTPELMWRHFFRGHNLWFMDTMDMVTDTTLLAQRRTLGHITAYAEQVNLLTMSIQGKGTSTPANSGYSLSTPTAGQHLALRLGSPLTFSVPAGSYACEWFNIDTAAIQSCGTVSGTPVSQPYTNAVLYLRSTGSPLPPPTQLAFGTQPVGAQAGATLAPVTVRVLDASGNLVSTSTATVGLTLTGTAGGTLGGDPTTNAVGGIATFNDLTVSPANSGYTLTAQSSGLTSATSNAFTMHASPASGATFWVTQGSGGSCASANQANGCTGGSCARGSINAGIACLSGGDTLIIGNGVYNEKIGDTGNEGSYTLTPIPAGTAGAYTTIKAQNIRGATLRPSVAGGNHRIIQFNSSSTHHIRMEGIRIDGAHFSTGMDECIQSFTHNMQFVDMECVDIFFGNTVSGNNVEFIQLLGPQCWRGDRWWRGRLCWPV